MRHKNQAILIACVVLATGIFIIDLYTPLGIADGVSYVSLVVLTLWTSRSSHTFIAAIVGTMLTIAGMLFSPVGEGASIFITNRVLAVIGIWAAAFVILRFKQSEKDARKMKDSLDALFAYATEGIIISNNAGIIEMINPEAEKQFGYEKSELLGKNIDLLATVAISTDNTTKKVEYYTDPLTHTSGKSGGQELTARRKDGTVFPVEISFSSYLLDGVRYVLAFIIDITERKRQEVDLKLSHEELKQYAVTLKETNAELENFAYISSHDLQEPLRKIQSFGDRLKTTESQNFTEAGKDYLERMINASIRMQRLINDLLRFSRLTSRSQEFVLTDLNLIANEVISDMEISIEKSNAKINIETLPSIVAEPTQLRQLFQNLIGNAIKFKTDEAEPQINISASIFSDENKKDFVQLNFKDNGIGFDMKYTDKIFNIFQRLEGKKYEGSGIGLAICKKIVLRHGGTLTATSAPGSGSVFTVVLPLSHLN
ncbi:hypothetical protein BH09BAC5_BH09BAC5_00380 [soil metagenome]